MSQVPYPNPLPVSVLEFPELVVSMALENELTARGLKLALFDPYRLSPSEHYGLQKRLEESTNAQQNPFLRALVGIATNPLTWLFMALAPASSAAKWVLFGKRNNVAMFLRDNGTFLQRIGFTNPLAEVGEGASGVALQTVRRVVQELRDEFAQILGPPLEALLRAQGLPTLNWQELARNSGQAIRAREIATALQAYLERWDQSVTEYRVLISSKKPSMKRKATILGTFTKPTDILKAPPKQFYMYAVKYTRGPIMGGGNGSARRLLQAVAGNEGVALADAIKNKLLPAVAKKMWGWDGKRLDTTRVIANQRLLADPLVRHTVSRELRGLSLAQFLMSDDIIAAARIPMNAAAWEKLVRATVEIPLKSGGYFPRRAVDAVRTGPKGSMGVGEVLGWIAAAKTPRQLRAASTIGRVSGMPLIHPDDLRFALSLFEEYEFGPGPAFSKIYRAANRAVHRTRRSDGTPVTAVFMNRINPDRALTRYLGETSAHIALTTNLYKRTPQGRWDISDIGAPVVEANERAIASGLYKSPGPLAHIVGLSYAASPAPGRSRSGELTMSIPIKEHMRGPVFPAGGFTLLDAIRADLAFMKNRISIQRMQDVYLPLALGLRPVQNALVVDAFIGLREYLAGILNSPLAQKAASLSPILARARERMLAWAEDPSGGQISTSLAFWLYGSHLGGNLGSVLLNMSQTLGPTLTIYGLRHTARGWANAVEDIYAYMKAWRPNMTEMERRNLIESVIPAAEHARLLQPIYEIMEAEISRLYRRRGLVTNLIKAGLVPFQAAETFNRLTNFYAHLSWAQSRGLLPAGSLRGRDLAKILRDPRYTPVLLEAERSVMEFQFPNEALNVPYLFQPGQIFGNPLMRQFGSFVLRSGAIPFTIMPSIADGVRYWRWGGRVPLPPQIVDLGRIIGSSAIVYELGKALNLDLTPYTGWAQISDIYPFLSQGRFQAEGGSALPFTPPAIDIPVSVIKALATDDRELLKRQIARLIPFGIAGTRLWERTLQPMVEAEGVRELIHTLGIQPQLLPPQTRALFADYAAAAYEDGRVPVLDSDGVLVGYQHPLTLIMRGFGVPVPETEGTGLHRYLINNAEEITHYRVMAYDALLAGDHSKFSSISSEFSRRFRYRDAQGREYPLPLILSPSGFEARARARTLPREARLFQGLPPEYRGLYGPAPVAAEAEGVP